LAEKLKSYFPNEEERKKLKILDIAAGTGLVGVGLKSVGFGEIDAVGNN
jgi:predicted RNA methylase